MKRLKRYDRARYHRERAVFKYFTVRIDHDTMNDLRRAASQAGTSQAELVRRYIEWGMIDDQQDPTRHRS